MAALIAVMSMASKPFTRYFAMKRTDVETLTVLLQEAETRHTRYEAIAPTHHWSGWYAGYVVARQDGKSPEEASREAVAHVERGARTET